MTTEVSLILWIVFMLALLAVAGQRSSQTIQPPQIVYVQAEAPQSSSAGWLLLIIFILLLLKAIGAW